jgi:anti-anti-sigma regulatory factor
MSPEPQDTEHLRNLLIYRDGGTLRARVSGPVNREASRRLSSLIGESRFLLHVDLGSADYLDSDGIRWLQQLQADAHSAASEVRLSVRKGSRIDRTVTLLKLDKMFRIERYGAEAEKPGRDSRTAPAEETVGSCC